MDDPSIPPPCDRDPQSGCWRDSCIIPGVLEVWSSGVLEVWRGGRWEVGLWSLSSISSRSAQRTGTNPWSDHALPDRTRRTCSLRPVCCWSRLQYDSTTAAFSPMTSVAMTQTQQTTWMRDAENSPFHRGGPRIPRGPGSATGQVDKFERRILDRASRA